MKVLKRKTLDELKAVMPVLSETEQAMYNGGTFYFDLSGNELGKVGTGNDLKFCTPFEYEEYKRDNIEGGGRSFIQLNDREQYSFVVNNSQFNNAQIFKHGANDSAAGLTSDGVLAINEDHFVWNNYYDALSTLEHEAYHYNNKHYTGAAQISNEIDTILNQIRTATFATTSYEYKRYTAEYLYVKYLEIGNYKTRAEVYQMVGITY